MKLKLPEIAISATGFTNLSDVDNHLRKILSPVLNQINRGKSDEGELAEVVEVYDLESKLPEVKDDDLPDYKLLGAIKFRKVYSQQWLADDSLPVAYPMNLNMVDFPVIGETVFIQKILDRFYYVDRVNQYGNPNNNSSLGTSQRFKIGDNNSAKKTLDTAQSGIVEDRADSDNNYLGNYFQPNFNIRQLVPNEGDTLLQGRFGNTIRLGSVENSPTIKLRAGQLADYDKFDAGQTLVSDLETKPLSAPIEENIDSDASSLWITTNEDVPITPATLVDTEIYPTETVPEVFNGKQIILNSGRLIFNSKEDGILSFSNGPLDFSTLNNFNVAAKQNLNLYSPNILIGRNTKTKNLALESNEVVINATDGNITALANKIELLGSQLREPTPAVRGDELRQILETMLEVMKLTTKSVQTLAGAVSAGLPAAVGGPAAVSLQVQQAAQVAGQITENIFKEIDTQIAIPTMLSRVIEIE
tara:strand:+ start:852 stop:2273 length:1422 start_codon:yes stop_codon:yes gene_type:complete